MTLTSTHLLGELEQHHRRVEVILHLLDTKTNYSENLRHLFSFNLALDITFFMTCKTVIH